MSRMVFGSLTILLASQFAIAQDVPERIAKPKHANILDQLQNDPGAIRSFGLDDAGNVTGLAISRHLSSVQIELVGQLTTLTSLTVAGPPIGGCCTAPPEELVAADKRRSLQFGRALPQLAGLKGMLTLHLLEPPTPDETGVVIQWRHLESFSGEIPVTNYTDLSGHTRLKHLDLGRRQLEPVSPGFLSGMTSLESLVLPPGFGDNTLEFLADKENLNQIQAEGISGEALVDYFTVQRGLPFFQALRSAGYSVEKGDTGRIEKLQVWSTRDMDRLFSEKILDRLTDLRFRGFGHVDGQELQFLRAIRNKPLEELDMLGLRMDPSIVTEICRISSLKRLSVSFSEPVVSVPSITGLPELEYLSVGGINDWKTNLAGLGDLPNLVEFRLVGGIVNDNFAKQLEGLPALKRLSLRNGVIDNAAVLTLSGLIQLESLDLSDSNIDDQDLTEFRNLPNLKSLDATNSRVSVNAYARFQQEHLGLEPDEILKSFQADCLQGNRPSSKNIDAVAFEELFGDELLNTVSRLTGVTSLRFQMTDFADCTLEPLA